MKNFKFKKNSIIATMAILIGLVGPITTFAVSPAIVNLLSAGNFSILSKTAISTTGATAITGDLGISPAAASFVTGFGLILDGSNTFSTSSLVTGNIYASNYAVPTPSYLTTAVSAMEAAFTDANGRSPGDLITDAGAPLSCATTCDLTGLSLVPGVYFFSGPGNVVITGNVTLVGSASDVWIFRIPGTLNLSSATSVLLSGGAIASNVFWAVSGTTTLQTTSVFEGNILGGPGASTIAMQNGATLHGKALGQTDVTLIANTITAGVGGGGSPATLKVVKQVINNPGGTLSASNFNLHVKLSGVDVSGSPSAGVVSPGSTYILSAGSYTVSEDSNPLYTQNFSGDCDSGGVVVLASANNKICTITNTSVPIVRGGGGGLLAIMNTPPPTIITPLLPPTPIVVPVVAPVIPKLPNTGYPSKEGSDKLNFIVLLGVSMLISTSFFIATKKRKA